MLEPNLPPIDTVPITTHYDARSKLDTKGIEIIEELLKREMVSVITDKQSRPMFIRFVPSGNTVYRCIICKEKPEGRAHSYQELQFAIRQSKNFKTYYLCPYCNGYDIEVLYRGMWQAVTQRPLAWFECKICGDKRPTANGIVNHYRLVRRMKKEHRTVLLQIKLDGILR